MILYVVRHGETEQNKFGLIQGQTESNLSDKGIKDAKKLISTLNDIDVDVVISSPLKRAIETAKIITEGKYPINIDDRLIERDWGLCEGSCVDDIDNISYWNFFKNTKDNQIEKVQDFMYRVSEFLEDIYFRYKNKNVLIVTHSSVLRAMHYCLHAIPEDGDMSKLNIPNLRLIEYEI